MQGDGQNSKSPSKTIHSSNDPYDWTNYTIARNEKKRWVGKVLKIGHRRRVQQATEGPQGMWRLAKWARSRSGAHEQGITPILTSPSGRRAETVEDKIELLCISLKGVKEAQLARPGGGSRRRSRSCQRNAEPQRAVT